MMNLEVFKLRKSKVVAYSLELEVIFNEQVEYLHLHHRFKSGIPYHLIIEFYTNSKKFPVKRCRLGYLKKNLEGTLMIEYINHNIESIKFDSDWKKTESVKINQETFFDLLKREEALIICNDAEKELMMNFSHYTKKIKTL